ncbi:HAD family hydrolase [Alkalispirochaeta alkalica]|uniref:HAD family hydrolase n=1 Tax=Alkalispirochaeta alkalica TaxID=46356 RepID=UPI000361AB59|nr:HAD family phosphatase [Alkalispirochaeta alkalica]
MNFIFDMGNVLSLGVDVIPAISEITGIAPQELKKFGGNDFLDLSVGTMEAEEFWQAFNHHFGTAVERDLIADCFSPLLDRRMEALIVTLRDRGFSVVCGTNTLESHYQHHLKQGDYRVFEKVYASHHLGLVKPDPRFFLTILEDRGWQAQDTLFVDDLPENVAAARKLGITAWEYRDYPPFEAFLLERNLLAEAVLPGA